MDAGVNVVLISYMNNSTTVQDYMVGIWFVKGRERSLAGFSEGGMRKRGTPHCKRFLPFGFEFYLICCGTINKLGE